MRREWFSHGERRAVVVLKLIQRIREEFEESPGLRVTIDEGARFWGLDAEVCELVLSEGAEGKTRFERQVTGRRVPGCALLLAR
jgi:hypothetical protein